MRLWWMTTALAASLFVSQNAMAGDNCPPGSWFCEEVDVPEQVEEEEVLETETIEEAPPPKKVKKIKKKKRTKKKTKKVERSPAEDVEIEADGDDTVVIVREGQSKVVVVERERRVAAPPPKPKKKKKREKRFADDFAIGARLEGAFFPSASEVHGDVGMGGLGGSVRWRPSRYFALDLGADVLGGTDYHGQDRVELAGSVSGIVYFNPQHAVQVYGLGGVHASHAWVGNDYDYYPTHYRGTGFGPEAEHDYVGAQAGIGVEFRIGKHFALHTDLLGLVRHRISDGPAEFQDPYTGETTDTSGSGLLRAGALFWW